jgi:hypothetical protein
MTLETRLFAHSDFATPIATLFATVSAIGLKPAADAAKAHFIQ